MRCSQLAWESGGVASVSPSARGWSTTILRGLEIVIGQPIDGGVTDETRHCDRRLGEDDLRDHAPRLELAFDPHLLVLTEGDEPLLRRRHDVQLRFAHEQGPRWGRLVKRHRARGQSHVAGIGEADSVPWVMGRRGGLDPGSFLSCDRHIDGQRHALASPNVDRRGEAEGRAREIFRVVGGRRRSAERWGRSQGRRRGRLILRQSQLLKSCPQRAAPSWRWTAPPGSLLRSLPRLGAALEAICRDLTLMRSGQRQPAYRRRDRRAGNIVRVVKRLPERDRRGPKCPIQPAAPPSHIEAMGRKTRSRIRDSRLAHAVHEVRELARVNGVVAP